MFSELQRRAEAQLRKQRKNQRPKSSDTNLVMDPQRMLHELQVHQVELELQNAELQESRDRAESLLENYTDLYDFAPVGYVSLDESGVILEANLTSTALLGIERSQLINRCLPIWIPEAGRPIFLTFLKEVFAGSRNAGCEVLVRKEGGGTFWAAFRATSAFSLKETRKWCRLTFGDITPRIDAERALRESEKRYQTLFDVIPAAVYSCDTKGVIQDFNRRAAQLWGRAPVLGDTTEKFCGSLKLFRPDGTFMPHAQCPMAEVVSGKRPEVRDAEVIIERADGSRIIVVVNIRPLENEHGAVTGAINCFYDITERKRAEEAQRRVDVLAASNQKLEKEIVRRRAVEASLKESEEQQRQLLAQSRQMQQQLRHLSHQILRAQEEERKRISRELHDEIAQTLTGINVRLAALKAKAGIDARELARKITSTQRLVEKSVKIVHKFARDLRPSVLDDLGLIPALQAFVKTFADRTRLRVRLRIFAGVEQLDPAKRTVLFRVAQEALTNVGRHAKASHVEMRIEKLVDSVHMQIKDNGRSFPVARMLNGKINNRLGLLGMRERVEMVGGKFSIESTPGNGTTIDMQIPFLQVRGGESLIKALEVNL